jgi:predicted TIM-barrel fold metal-dependent hydrolase
MGDLVFDSLRRWTRRERDGNLEHPPDLPLTETLKNMDGGGVSLSLISAWFGPRGAMISNDEVAGFVREAPDRLVGVGSVDISRPMEAVREIRRCVRERASSPTCRGMAATRSCSQRTGL